MGFLRCFQVSQKYYSHISLSFTKKSWQIPCVMITKCYEKSQSSKTENQGMNVVNERKKKKEFRFLILRNCLGSLLLLSPSHVTSRVHDTSLQNFILFFGLIILPKPRYKKRFKHQVRPTALERANIQQAMYKIKVNKKPMWRHELPTGWEPALTMKKVCCSLKICKKRSHLAFLRLSLKASWDGLIHHQECEWCEWSLPKPTL